jgi:WD40 repeat protein
LRHAIKGHDGPVRSVAADEAGRHVISAGFVKANTAGRHVPSTGLGKGDALDLHIVPDGEERALIWSAESGKLLRALPGDRGGSAVAITRDGKRVATGGYRSLKIWDADTGKLLLTIPTTMTIQRAAFSADGNRVVGSGVGGKFKVWDAETGQELLHLVSECEDVSNLASDAPTPLLIGGPQP